jgi:hypothetical protein
VVRIRFLPMTPDSGRGLRRRARRRSRACRCFRGRHPSGSCSEARDHRGGPPSRSLSGAPEPSTLTPL